MKWNIQDENDSISWFLMDMDKDAREGIAAAKPWEWEGDNDI